MEKRFSPKGSVKSGFIALNGEAGFQPKVDLHSNDYQVILSAVQAGLGVSMVPPLALFASYPGVVYRRPADVHVERTLSALVRRGSGRSPAIASMLAALDVLASVPGRHVAVLGDMFELGDAEQEGHRSVGRAAAGVAQWLVAVGQHAQDIATEARAGGLPANAVLAVPDAEAAVAPLREQLRAGDVVLIKGSRGMHLETIVNALAETAPAPKN